MAHFSLTWDAYKQNICSGLSTLQQNGEFVDMTLAADGHHVKVHQLVLSLVSPYIKELIASAACPHPVIFLNKISYITLCSILEYIYTGEVHIAKDNLVEVIEAAKELHIKGLEEMKLEVSTQELISQAVHSRSDSESTPRKLREDREHRTVIKSSTPHKHDAYSQNLNLEEDQMSYEEVEVSYDEDTMADDGRDDARTETNLIVKASTDSKQIEQPIQYTISNQGSLQMILNRYMYYLRYTGRRAAHRQWRCINYVHNSTRCPASVITKDDVIIRRFAAHNHPFHDTRILKKVRDRAVYGAITDAELVSSRKRRQRATTADHRVEHTE